MQGLTRERLPRFQFGHTKKKEKSKKIEKGKIQKKQKKKKKEKSKKLKIKKEQKELVFSSPGQNMRLLSLPYS